MKEFDIDKDVLGIRQSVQQAARFRLLDFLPSMLAKLQLRSPMLQSIIGFPSICSSQEITTHYRSEIVHITCQFTNLKRIDFGACGLRSTELVEFLTSSASRDRLVEINSSAYYLRTNEEWPPILETSESQESRLKLQKLHLKSEYLYVYLDPRIIDLIDLSSLTALVLDQITAPSYYLLSLIRNCNHLQKLQFSFMTSCRCKNRPCVHLISSNQILEAISAIENLDSLKISEIKNGNLPVDRRYLDINNDLQVLIERLCWRGRLVEFGLLTSCSPVVIAGIGHHLTSLKSLEIMYHSSMSTRPGSLALVNMTKQMVHLEKWIFKYGSDQQIYSNHQTSVVPLAKNLKNLRNFQLWCPAIGSDYLGTRNLQELTHLEHLEELSIIGGSYPRIKWGSATFGLQLQNLELRNCHEEFVASVLKHTPGLRRLVLSGSLPLSDKILRMIPAACPRLREFSMFLDVGIWADNMKEGVHAIVDGCPELELLRC